MNLHRPFPTELTIPSSRINTSPPVPFVVPICDGLSVTYTQTKTEHAMNLSGTLLYTPLFFYKLFGRTISNEIVSKR